MDRSALIHKLRTEVDCGPCSLIRDVADLLEADAQKEAAVKALCDEWAYTTHAKEIRAIYGWREES